MVTSNLYNRLSVLINKVILTLLLMISTPLSAEESIITHMDKLLGYSIEMPENRQRTIASENRKHTYLLNITAEDLSESSNFHDGNADYWTAAYELARIHCAADGPDGGSYCRKISQSHEFVTHNGLPARKVYLKLIQEEYDYDQEKMVERTSLEIGPIYLVDISRPGYPFVIMIGDPLSAPREHNLRITNSVRLLANSDFSPKKPPRIQSWAKLKNKRDSADKLWTQFKHMGIQLRIPPDYQSVESKRAIDVFDENKQLFLHMDAIYAPPFRTSYAIPRQQQRLAFTQHMIQAHYAVTTKSGSIIRAKIISQRRHAMPLENGPYYTVFLGETFLEVPMIKKNDAIQWEKIGPIFMIEPSMALAFAIVATPGSALKSDDKTQMLWSMFSSIRPLAPALFKPVQQTHAQEVWQTHR